MLPSLGEVVTSGLQLPQVAVQPRLEPGLAVWGLEHRPLSLGEVLLRLAQLAQSWGGGGYEYCYVQVWGGGGGGGAKYIAMFGWLMLQPTYGSLGQNEVGRGELDVGSPVDLRQELEGL